MAADSGKANFIKIYRQTVADLIISLETLRSLRAEWDALGYSTGMADGDFFEENSGITAAEFATAVSSSGVLYDAFSGSGHDTNLYKVKA